MIDERHSVANRWVFGLTGTAAIIEACPESARSNGIVIWMYHDEIHHLGRPHFHARYADDEASVDIETLAIIAGELPPRAVRIVAEWARQHQVELRENWDLARRHQPLQPIDPLR